MKTAGWMAALLVCVAGCGAPKQGPQTAANAGTSGTGSNASMAPDFSVELLNGETFRLSDHLGKDVIVIDFWATFCVPCVQVLEHLEKLHAVKQKEGLVVLAVAMDPPETTGAIGPFVRSHNLTFRIAHDVDSQITQLYNKKSAAPYQVLIGRNGQVIKRRETYQPGDEAGMEADIKAALAQH